MAEGVDMTVLEEVEGEVMEEGVRTEEIVMKECEEWVV